ncbi:ATPase [Prevotella sp. E15-22]|uniref:ATPase n=1 Tax=Prevotella sp. E15-22 TaxID=2937774 RepID=UPI00205EBC48|nr:ATPase [Prevotella sp. E15-22]UPS43374.1 ATPase [Prevotella sp. E15-22]
MKQHILIADSGSTKTEWDLDGLRIKTQGINPFHQDDDTIRAILCDELLPQLYSHCSVSEFSSLKVSFYGSGVRPELEEKIVRLLSEAFPEAKQIDAHSDLLGAAIALCGHSEGIACILGTGANSCLFDGQRIVKNTPPMGYVLGDEGSGAVLGIRFLNALYKDRLPHTILSDFEAYIGMNLAQVVDRVYRQPLANRWLASLSEFIHAHVDEPLIEALVVENFRDFLRYNVDPYGRRDLPVSALGSIAYYYQSQFLEALKSEGYTVGKILRGPLDGLVRQTV